MKMETDMIYIRIDIFLKPPVSYWDKWWNLKMVSGLNDSMPSMLNVLILKIILCLYKRLSFFLGNTHWSIQEIKGPHMHNLF